MLGFCGWATLRACCSASGAGFCRGVVSRACVLVTSSTSLTPPFRAMATSHGYPAHHCYGDVCVCPDDCDCRLALFLSFLSFLC